MPRQLEYTPEELVTELERQSAQAQTLAVGLSEAALNWQPNGGKSWSIAQCLDHLTTMNAIYLKALQAAVESNRDQLEPRKVPIQASGWLMRLVSATKSLLRRLDCRRRRRFLRHPGLRAR